jgi:hypothetical protein
MTRGVQTSFSTWDFHNNRIVAEARGGQFVSAETTLVAAGPPSLRMSYKKHETRAASGNNPAESAFFQTEVYPLGLLESFGLQQNKQLQRIFEIGSSRSYFVPGRVIGSVSLGRAFYSGPNLLKALYADYRHAHINAKFGAEIIKEGKGTGVYPIVDPANALITSSVADEAMYHFRRNPGYDNYLVDLASDLFSQPTGMAVYFKTYDSRTVGAFYLEECYVQGYQLNISSSNVLIMEGAQIQYDLLTPIKMVTSLASQPT